MKKIYLWIAGLALVVFAFQIFSILNSAGAFKTIVPHGDKNGVLIPLPVAGPEDLELERDSMILFISSDDRRDLNSNSGAILAVNLKKPGTEVNIVSPQLNDFHPHGFSLYKDGQGRVFLLVISHKKNPASSVVERFEWINGALIHLETITDPNIMTSPNDIVAVGERSFYFTNDHYYTQPGLGKTFEEYLQRPISYIGFFNGEKFSIAAEGLSYANGINRSPGGDTVYATSTTGRKLHVYSRLADGGLKLEVEVPLETGADNIDVDTNGNLLIGCHPQLLKFVKHAEDPSTHSPSQVLRVFPSNGFKVEEIFLNDGGQYSGSSVAVQAFDKLYIGAVFESSLLVVTMASPQ
ncbi:MAG: hypothetical protein FJZ78_11540 [Bacteroidetes bacterium]|nr:hypothetical protein [Bacteroidota bacterium]